MPPTAHRPPPTGFQPNTILITFYVRSVESRLISSDTFRRGTTRLDQLREGYAVPGTLLRNPNLTGGSETRPYPTGTSEDLVELTEAGFALALSARLLPLRRDAVSTGCPWCHSHPSYRYVAVSFFAQSLTHI